ncbi:dihydroorotase family protein [Pseudoroseomonas cervicalis]|uniref:Amidohydrolase family protein n=1 Tax=Pseudoroseomonas cervicalis ATCC 49957 TaxID=525371 RepID=D5RRX5_9PROT|nr:amidohydrolase family protein [Pseudoroseomonas cervicalis]EFH09936.1 amidohydrolase family protein [Pseudoroseomonas cervicalis ATCC 49957]
MPLPYDRVLRGNLVLPDGILRDGYVAVRGESIAAIGEGELPPATAVDDFSGRYILPGLVDGHMHTGSAIGWPGIEGASMSAAAGGVTTICDMPYDVPRAVTSASIFREKVEAVHQLSHVDVALYATIRKSGGVDEIAGLAEAGASAFKLSTYEYDAVRFPRIDHPTMVAAFAEIAKTGLMVAVHNEDQELVERLTAEAKATGRVDPIMHARTRPPLAETMADLEIFEIGLETGAHVHIAHSSVARGFDIAESFRAMGAKASGEACIQYLCMTEEDLVRLKGFGKCNPPFRTAEEVERMWAAFAAGKIAYVSTDHAPWQREKKLGDDIFACGAGLTGLQSFAPLMFSLLRERGLPLTLMAKYCAENTARYHGLFPKKGAIRLGSDADFLVMEEGEYLFDESTLQDRPDARWSPYHGRRMTGRVAATFLRGACVWDGGAVLARPGQGRFVPRQHRDSALG